MVEKQKPRNMWGFAAPLTSGPYRSAGELQQSNANWEKLFGPDPLKPRRPYSTLTPSWPQSQPLTGGNLQSAGTDPYAIVQIPTPRPAVPPSRMVPKQVPQVPGQALQPARMVPEQVPYSAPASPGAKMAPEQPPYGRGETWNAARQRVMGNVVRGQDHYAAGVMQGNEDVQNALATATPGALPPDVFRDLWGAEQGINVARQQQDVYGKEHPDRRPGMRDAAILAGAYEAAPGTQWTGPNLPTGLKSGAQRAAELEAENRRASEAARQRGQELMANSAGKAYGPLPFAHEGTSKADAQRLAVARAGELSDAEWQQLYPGVDRTQFQPGGTYHLTIPSAAMPGGSGSLQASRDYYDKEFWDKRDREMEVNRKNIRETGDPRFGLADLRREAQSKLGQYAGKTLTEEGKAEYGALRGALKSLDGAKLRGRQMARAYETLLSKIDSSGLDSLVVKEPELEESFNKNVRIDKENGVAWIRGKRNGDESWDAKPLPDKSGDWYQGMPETYRGLASKYPNWEAFQKAVDERYKQEAEAAKSYNDSLLTMTDAQRQNKEPLQPRTRSEVMQSMLGDYNELYGTKQPSGPYAPVTPTWADGNAPYPQIAAPASTDMMSVTRVQPTRTPAPAYAAPPQSGSDMMSVTPPAQAAAYQIPDKLQEPAVGQLGPVGLDQAKGLDPMAWARYYLQSMQSNPALAARAPYDPNVRKAVEILDGAQ